MAQEIIGLKVEVDGSSASKSVGSLKQQLKEAQAEVTALSEKFGATSIEAVSAAKRAAELKDAIGDAKTLTDAFNPDAKFRAFSSSLSAVAGGFSAIQGAMALVGAESQSVEKTLLKVQSAMALSQGLQAIGEGIDSFKQMKAVAIDAFKGIKTAIGSTGIGLLVIALGTIYTYWDNIKEAVSGVSAEQQKLNSDTAKNLEIEKQKLSTIGNQDNILKLQGKSEKQILQIKIAQTDQVIAATEQQIKQQKITLSAQIEAEKRNKEILKGILEFTQAPIVLILKGIDAIGKAVGKDFNLAEKFTGGVAEFFFDPKKLEEKGQAELKELDNQLAQLKNAKAGYQLAIQSADKAANDKAAADAKAANDQLLQANQELSKSRREQANDIFLSEIEDAKMREEIRIATQFEADKKEIEQSKASKAEKDLALLTLQAKYLNDLKVLDDAEKEKQILKSQEDLTILIGQLTAEEQVNLEYLERDKKIKEEYRLADLEATKDLQDKKFQAVNAGLDLIQSLSGKNEVLGNIFFTIQKAIEIGRIITSTSSAIAKVSADTAAIPALIPPGVPNPAFPAAVAIGAKKIAGLKIGAAASIAGIVASSIAKFKGGAGAAGIPAGTQAQSAGVSAPAPIAPPAPLVNTRTQLDSETIQKLGSATNRAYVVESDVTNSQERIRRINRAARLA